MPAHLDAEEMKKENKTSAQISRVLLKTKFQKPHTKVVNVQKTGVELTMMVGYTIQEVSINRENTSMLLYTAYHPHFAVLSSVIRIS